MKGYELLEHLSRGHAYDVYDAWSHERGCRVILRTLRPGRGGRDRLALIREGRLLQRFSHPHIVRAYETRWLPDTFVVLETLGGATLSAILDDSPLDDGDAVQLGVQLASAVQYIHRQGWLHLDLKPSNVIADGGRAKLIDLSISQRPGRVDPGTGSPGFMSPEQEHGGRVSEATDVWGLGAVLRAAGGLDDLAAACLREDPRERLPLECAIGWLNRMDASLRGESAPHPQPAA